MEQVRNNKTTPNFKTNKRRLSLTNKLNVCVISDHLFLTYKKILPSKKKKTKQLLWLCSRTDFLELLSTINKLHRGLMKGNICILWIILLFQRSGQDRTGGTSCPLPSPGPPPPTLLTSSIFPGYCSQCNQSQECFCLQNELYPMFIIWGRRTQY